MSQNSPKQPADDPKLDSDEVALQGSVAHDMRHAGTDEDHSKEPEGDKEEFDGVVQEVLPNHMYRVWADNGLGVLATCSGRMLQYYIKIAPGDRVTVEVSPYDPTRGRITYLHK